MSNVYKILLQTSKDKPTEDHIKNLMTNADGWSYIHFNDNEILDFFDKNPIPGFENISKKFYEIRMGEHRADLFRYYYLYLNGGFFLDLDFVLFENINNVIKDYDFVSAAIKNSDYTIANGTKRPRVFNGYMYTKKHSNIMYQALLNLYKMDIDDLGPETGWDSRYHVVCEQLYHIVNSQPDNTKIKLFRITDDPASSLILDGDKVLGQHMHTPKPK